MLLAKRRRAIAAALSSMRDLPRDIQNRILRESGLYDMPAKGYYLDDYTAEHTAGQDGFY